MGCYPRVESPRHALGSLRDEPLALAFPRALANLYEDPEWSQKDLVGPIESLKTQVTKSKLGVLAPSQLWRYRQELAERARLGYPTCFTDLWALVSEALLHDQVWEGYEWEQGTGWSEPGPQEAMASGSNSLPPAPRPQTLRPAGGPESWPEPSAHLLCPQHQGKGSDHL